MSDCPGCHNPVTEGHWVMVDPAERLWHETCARRLPPGPDGEARIAPESQAPFEVSR